IDLPDCTALVFDSNSRTILHIKRAGRIMDLQDNIGIGFEFWSHLVGKTESSTSGNPATNQLGCITACSSKRCIARTGIVIVEIHRSLSRILEYQNMVYYASVSGDNFYIFYKFIAVVSNRNHKTAV